MRIGKRSIAGLLTASLLLPVPALAIQQKAAKATGRVTPKQSKGSATAVIDHEHEERLEYKAFARDVRAQFRGNTLEASVKKYLNNVLKDLRAHWRAESRTGVVSPFNFPDV